MTSPTPPRSWVEEEAAMYSQDIHERWQTSAGFNPDPTIADVHKAGATALAAELKRRLFAVKSDPMMNQKVEFTAGQLSAIVAVECMIDELTGEGSQSREPDTEGGKGTDMVVKRAELKVQKDEGETKKRNYDKADE